MTAQRIRCAAVVAAALAFASTAQADDQILFAARDNITNQIVQHIRAETVRLDISAWYLTEHLISQAIAERAAAGLPIRLIGDRVAIFESDPHTKTEFYYLANLGVPIRLRFNPTWVPEINHWKMAIFVGQNLVEFGSANWTTFELAPWSATNYDDETAMFSSDPTLLNAFKTRFDRMWNDTTPEPESIVSSAPYLKDWDNACRSEPTGCDFFNQFPNAKPMTIGTTRLEPDYPSPPDLIWGQGSDFNGRLAAEISREPSSLQLVVYRLTVDNITSALLERWAAGVKIQLLVEPDQYANRTWPEYWITHANIDKLWAAGIPIRQRAHDGMTHMKTLVTSAYATNASSNYSAGWQRDHDYFVSASLKPAIYTAIKNQVAAMWNDPSGFVPFQPQPPDPPALEAPAAGAVGVGPLASLSWKPAPFATDYDVYLGTSAGSLALVANVKAQLVNNPPATYTWTPPAPLRGVTTYYWQVVSRTNATPRNAALVARSAVRTFVTGQPSATDFDGDGIADPTIFRANAANPQGYWYVDQTRGGTRTITWGVYGDIPVSADYDGDHRLDAAVWRPSTGFWYILKSSTGNTQSLGILWGSGSMGDVPVPGDYDGDGKADLAVWRPSTGVWFILLSSTNYTQSRTIAWGAGSQHDVPVPADFDGDGVIDPAVWRPAAGTWFILLSRSQFTKSIILSWGTGALADRPLTGDYDGDGRADPVIWRPGTGQWFILRSSAGYSAWMTTTWGSGSLNDDRSSAITMATASPIQPCGVQGRASGGC